MQMCKEAILTQIPHTFLNISEGLNHVILHEANFHLPQ